MKFLFAVLLLCGWQSWCYAQAIEQGTFMCTSMRQEAWNNESQKLDITRDWVNLPEKSIAVKVYKDSIVYYTDSFHTRTAYKILKTDAQPDRDYFADHTYEVTANGLKSQIMVRLLSGYGGYAGQIKIADGPVGDHYTRVITYTFTKSESDLLAAK